MYEYEKIKKKEVMKAIGNLKSRKVAQVDGIMGEML